MGTERESMDYVSFLGCTEGNSGGFVFRWFCGLTIMEVESVGQMVARVQGRYIERR